jgi:tRNA-uridine 2-sulfurtransferase
MKKTKALVLTSGGLDSILAAVVLKKQGIDVTALSFKGYFFNEEKAITMTNKLGINLEVVDFSKEHLDLIKKPKYGYGSAMNPCIDCHLMMIKKAGEIMKKEKYDIVVTGEVLGQRPMSQNREALKLIERQSGIEGYLLRPLSAKLLDPTIPEQQDLIYREKLLDISGRSRQIQMKLADEYGIKDYPTPAGGCLLTESIFGKRLKTIFDLKPDCNGNDVELLKYGRHFLEGKTKIIVGRDQDENIKLEDIAQTGDVLVEMKEHVGPTTLVRSYENISSDDVLEKAKELTQHYSVKVRDKKDIEFIITRK